jgi:hypothetical protein
MTASQEDIQNTYDLLVFFLDLAVISLMGLLF